MLYINTWFQNKLRLYLLLAGICAFSLQAQAELKEGDSIPDFASMGLVGEMPDIEGKVILLDFWASWCTPCKASFPIMEKLYAQYKDQGFEILAVSVDKKSKAYQKFSDKASVNFPLLHDKTKSLVQFAEIEAMPTSFLIDKKGKVRAIHSGFHGKKTEKQYIIEIESLLAE